MYYSECFNYNYMELVGYEKSDKLICTSGEGCRNTNTLRKEGIIVDNRVSARQDPAKYQTHIWRLGRAIKDSLKVDRRRRTEESGKEVERFLGAEPPLHRES